MPHRRGRTAGRLIVESPACPRYAFLSSYHPGRACRHVDRPRKRTHQAEPADCPRRHDQLGSMAWHADQAGPAILTFFGPGRLTINICRCGSRMCRIPAYAEMATRVPELSVVHQSPLRLIEPGIFNAHHRNYSRTGPDRESPSTALPGRRNRSASERWRQLPRQTVVRRRRCPGTAPRSALGAGTRR